MLKHPLPPGSIHQPLTLCGHTYHKFPVIYQIQAKIMQIMGNLQNACPYKVRGLSYTGGGVANLHFTAGPSIKIIKYSDLQTVRSRSCRSRRRGSPGRGGWCSRGSACEAPCCLREAGSASGTSRRSAATASPGYTKIMEYRWLMYSTTGCTKTHVN